MAVTLYPLACSVFCNVTASFLYNTNIKHLIREGEEERGRRVGRSEREDVGV